MESSIDCAVNVQAGQAVDRSWTISGEPTADEDAVIRLDGDRINWVIRSCSRVKLEVNAAILDQARHVRPRGCAHVFEYASDQDSAILLDSHGAHRIIGRS